jgi:hypothetical protein
MRTKFMTAIQTLPLRLAHWLFSLLLVACAARAEVEASLDLRLVASDGRNGFLDAGFGKLRFDADNEGLQLGRARLAWRGSIGGDWHANVDVSTWSFDDKNAVDLTEASLEWRPVPKSAWRSKLKIGAYYPPISLEHRASGWSNPYTISSSALNTWVGEELRTIGIGYELEHLGIADGERLDFGVNAAVFGWNDPAGVELALRGFSLNDRQTPLFGRIGTYAFGDREQRVIFSEVDHRAGYHLGAYIKGDTGLELRALHYDNRGNRTVYKESIDDFAWDTSFDSVGFRYDAAGGTTLIAQYMKGRTYASSDHAFCWDFKTWFALIAREFGKHRFAMRYDDFSVLQTTLHSPPPWSKDLGNAWTLGWTWAVRDHLEVSAEWLRIKSLHTTRSALGESARAVEHSAQLALKIFL